MKRTIDLKAEEDLLSLDKVDIYASISTLIGASSCIVRNKRLGKWLHKTDVFSAIQDKILILLTLYVAEAKVSITRVCLYVGV